MLERLRQFAIYIIALLIAIGMGLSIPIGIGELIDAVQAQPVQAAGGSEPVTSDNCELVGEVEDIRNYYCEPDFGPPYFQNSVGFVVVVN